MPRKKRIVRHAQIGKQSFDFLIWRVVDVLPGFGTFTFVSIELRSDVLSARWLSKVLSPCRRLLLDRFRLLGRHYIVPAKRPDTVASLH